MIISLNQSSLEGLRKDVLVLRVNATENVKCDDSRSVV